MIKAGIKIGPKNWVKRLLDSQAKCCEVWFQIDKETEYVDMFQFLNQRQIQTGLHFWGVIEDNILVNPAYPDKTIRNNSILLIEKCIEIATRNGFSFVNIHPGYAQLWKFEAEKQIFKIADNSKQHYQDSKHAFRESAVLLHEYGQKNNVSVLWETLPKKTITNYVAQYKDKIDRLDCYPTHAINSFTLEEIAKKDGIFITNDISHTMTEIQSQSEKEIINYLFDRTEKLASYTKLLHINTLSRPYNGTDSHDGITDADFNNEVIPAKDQLLQLLKIFKGRNDVWAINEPRHKHVQNYMALKELLMNFRNNGISGTVPANQNRIIKNDKEEL